MKWFKQLFSRCRLYDDLSEEIQEHLEEKIEELVASGMPRKEAAAAARREFGNVTLIEEDSRAVWQWPSIENLLMDVRYALRNLRKDYRFAFIAICALALGIGASTVVFSVVYSVFFRAVPYREFNRSVVLHMDNLGSAGGWKVRSYFFPEEMRAFREQNDVFEDVICYGRMRPTYDDGKSIRFFFLGRGGNDQYICLPRCPASAGPRDLAGRWTPRRSARVRNELSALAARVRR